MDDQGEDMFRLSPVDVRRFEFGTSMRGYDRQRVDNFRDQVADELESLIHENADLDGKNRALAEQLKHFRERDKALNEALVSAQLLREEMKGQAEREAALIIQEAEAQASRLQERARGEIAELQRELKELERTRRAYLAQLKALAERHLAEVAAFEQAPSPGASESP
ncbi:MAG: DivIVA domain-containing protein [Gemmatimonadaceae bacterium]|nr:DivIVA domain-containing protein [Gemmatimonadaceae bacterium]